MTMQPHPVRLGILGASWIAPIAIIEPAANISKDDLEVCLLELTLFSLTRFDVCNNEDEGFFFWSRATLVLMKVRRVVKVVAIAARDSGRAVEFATKHRLPKVYKSYDDLLEDPDIGS